VTTCRHPRASRTTPNSIAQCRVCFRVVIPVTCYTCQGQGDFFDSTSRRYRRCLDCDRGVLWVTPDSTL